MSQYHRLFLICDESHPGGAAVEQAAAMARATGASIHLCLFDHSEAIALIGLVDREGMEKARDGFMTQRRATAQSLANTLKAKGIQATADVAWARPAHVEMLRQIEELRPDLVIKQTRHEALLKRTLFTPTDWHLLRHCPVPLLLVHGGDRPLLKRIVAAVDPGPYEPGVVNMNQRILREALALAIQSDGELHLVFALDTLAEAAAALAGPAPGFSPEAYGALVEMRTKAFDALADEHGVPAERRHLLKGGAGPAIADFASQWQADVIVLGTTQRPPLDRWIMGSTAEQILDYAPCSILAVPPGAVAPLPKM